MTRNNNAPPIVEEIVIEDQTVEELKEQLRILKNELKEKEEENEELDKLVWEGIEKLGNERNEKNELKEENKKFRLLSLFRKNNIKKLLRKWSSDEKKVYELEKENKEKVKEIVDLKQELAREKQKKEQTQRELTDLQTKYDMEVKNKEELMKYLSIYRRQTILEYSDGVLAKNEIEIEDFINQHTCPYLYILSLKLTDDRVIDFEHLKPKLLFVESSFAYLDISYSRMVRDDLPAPKIILNNLPKSFKKIDLPKDNRTFFALPNVVGSNSHKISFQPEVVVNYKD